MSREIKGPLSADDIAWLKSRYPMSYVERMKDLHGVKGKADSESAQAKAEAKAREEQEKAEAAAAKEAAAAQRAADEAAAAEAAGADDEEDDLIGDVFDVIGSTEPEVKEWAEKASDEEKAAALSTEQARTDRDPRKGVVALLST